MVKQKCRECPQNKAIGLESWHFLDLRLQTFSQWAEQLYVCICADPEQNGTGWNGMEQDGNVSIIERHAERAGAP